jgi:hypothetical protein
MTGILSPLAGAGWQFFNNSGVPLAGGKIYTYVAGTSTPQVTYTTRAATVAHSNPIILDSAGRVPSGEVWLVPNFSYKFLIQDSNDVLIGSYDDLPGVTFGSNSIVVYGADPTGATSSVAAIQACQEANDQIYIPTGEYLINSSLTITSGATIDAGVTFNITQGTFVFQAGSVPFIKPEWFYFGGGYQTAFTKAFQVLRDSVVSTQAMSAYGATIPVWLEGNKQYIISGSITGVDYLHLEGNTASILTSAAYPFDHSYPILTNIGYQPIIRNVTFVGGYDVLVFPENNQGWDIIISNCKFSDWLGVAIYGSPIPHAQHLICTACEFTARSVNSTICDIAWDKAVMKDCQYSGPSQTKFINRDSLVLEDWITSPQSPPSGEVWSDDPRWIYNVGLEMIVNRFRFGGEEGAHRIIQNEIGSTFQGGTTTVSITNSAIYTGDDYLMMLNAMPSNFIFRDNYGMIATSSILYGPSASLSDNLNIGRTNLVLDAGIYGSSRLTYGSLSATNNSATVKRIATTMNRYNRLGTNTVTTASKVVDLTYISMSGAANPNFTVQTSTDIFGATVQRIIGYDGDSTFNSYSYFQTTSLTGLTAGTYTIVVNITIGANGGVAYAGNPVSFGMVGSLCEKYWNLTPGSHTLSVEFHWDGTNNPDLGYSVYNVDATTYFDHNGFRLFQGSVDMTTWETITYATAAPSSGYHRKNDRVIQSVPTVGQPNGWVCTVAGTPGTWVALSNL